ncbi:site-specific integrase [bacterium]|nr:site-specific integrase [bacterium]
MEKIKRKDGVKYRERIYIGGQEFKSPCFEKKSDAIAWKSVKLAERRVFDSTGVMPAMKSVWNDMKFKDFAKWWITHRVAPRSSLRTVERYEATLKNHIYDFIGELHLSQITREHADQLIAKLREAKHNPVGTNLIMGVFKQVVNEAFKQEKIAKYPFADYAKVKEPKRDDHFMSAEEIEKFLDVNKDDPHYWLYVIAMNTGMRRGELAGLLWDRVDFEKGFIHISRLRDRNGLADRTKTRNSQRRIPMSHVVREGLTYLKERGLHPEYVFCTSYGKPFDEGHAYWYFRRAQKRAGLTNHYRFHDLRHTFASHFVMNGGSLYDLQKVLGHARFDETQRYAHLTPEHLAKSINIVSFGGKPPPAPSEIVVPAAEQKEILIAPEIKTPALRIVGPA